MTHAPHCCRLSGIHTHVMLLSYVRIPQSHLLNIAATSTIDVINTTAAGTTITFDTINITIELIYNKKHVYKGHHRGMATTNT